MQAHLESQIEQLRTGIVAAEQNTVWSPEYRAERIAQLKTAISNLELEIAALPNVLT